jgi:hypothetical protein
MLLQRFVKHFTDQNWFAVSLDVIIVISGIFIGMQLNEWNGERVEKQQEQIFLSQLERDIEHIISSVGNAKREHIVSMVQGKLALRYLRGEDLYEEYKQDIESVFENTHEIPKPQIIYGNLGTLLDGRNYPRISNTLELTEINSLLNELRTLIDVYHLIEEMIIETTKINREMIGFSIPNDPSFPIQYNIDELKESSTFRNRLQNTMRLHNHAAQMLEQMNEHLSKYLDKK